MIISLVIHIFLFLFVRINKNQIIHQTKQINIETIDIPKTWQKKKILKPSPPPKPTIPVPLEHEYIPDDETIIPTELDLSEIPPPPLPPPDEYDYENYMFIPHETPPEIIGGYKSIIKKVRYPAIAKKIKLEGRTVIAVLIDKNGNIAKYYILQSAGFKGFDNEALRVLITLKFKPAKQRDIPVKVWMAIPFKFQIK